LDVRHGRWFRSLEKIEPGTAHENEAEVSKQFLIVLLADSVEIHDLAIQIVQNFDIGRLFTKENLTASSKCLDVRRMFRKNRNHPHGQAVFSAHVGKR
jgi:hypothetical protein